MDDKKHHQQDLTPFSGVSEEKKKKKKIIFFFFFKKKKKKKTMSSHQQLIFIIKSDFNIHEWTLWSLWLIAAFVLMIMYEAWWVRYFRSERKLSDFYSSFLGIPLASATLPVIAFFMLGMYGKVVCMLIAALILGIGHLGIHIQHKKSIDIEPTNL